jgi:hypothetical protein
MYMPPDIFQDYKRLLMLTYEAASVKNHNAEQARLAREQMALPWWKRIFGGGDDDRSSSDKRGPLSPRLVVAAAVVLLVIVIVVVVALVKRKNGGHQKFSSQPAQGLWGYDWTASGGCPR